MPLPTFDDVLCARDRLGGVLAPTPLYASPRLSELVGADVWVKHENHQPVGAFKVRGGVNLAAALDEDVRGLICASTGNHGQSVAYAARRAGLPATVCLPAKPNPIKAAGIRALGACLAARALRPHSQVIGVQSSAAPAAYRSWRARRLLDDRMETFAEGLATRTACEVPQRILWRELDDFLLVSDDEIRRAMVLMIEGTRSLVEAAGAAPLAAALKLRARLAGRHVALIASGGNVSVPQLRDVLTGASG